VRRLELLALTLDPRQPLDDSKTHLIVVESLGRSNAHATHRRVDTDVQVLDVLVDDVDVDATDGQGRR
jgi:hypothetical protein